MAQDVFVHHFGSRTFTALGVDHRQQLQENFERFRAKWGPEHCAGYRIPPLATNPPTPSPSPTKGEGSQTDKPPLAAAPQAVWPRVVSSHVLLQEGKDPATAEQVLREVLALDPGNAQAQHNLAVLLSGHAAGGAA